TLDKLENEEEPLISLSESIDSRDTGLVQRSEHFGFSLKPANTVRNPGELRGQDFDRHFAFQLRVAGAVHLSHSALAEQGGDFIGTELRTGSKSHTFARII